MKRLSMCILFLGLATTSCTIPDPLSGPCGNDYWRLGDVECQCVTPDKEYSEDSVSYEEPALDYLEHCWKKDTLYSQKLAPGDTEIYVCIHRKCAIKQCDDGYVSDQGKRKCIAMEDRCDMNKELYDATKNTCKCDVSKHFEGKAGSCTCETNYVLINGVCEAKQTCREDQVYVEADNTCACPTDYEEQDGRKCVHTGICTGANQVYDPDKDVCVCAEGTLRFGDACIAKDECTGSSRRMISQSDPGACTCFTEYTYIIDDCYKAGETLTFGRYPQDEDSDTPSPLKWRILEINDGAALLISEYVLEQYRYHDTREDITWEKSNVRSYLNGLSAAFNKNGIDHYGKGFIDKAFTAEERRWIKQVTNKNPAAPEEWNSTPGGNDTEDKVFLLSRDEALKYFSTNKSRIASPTAYAIHPPEGSGHNNLHTCQVKCSDDKTCSGSGCNMDGSNVQV